MSANLAGTKELLVGMAAEARELQSAAGGSVTDTVAGWLASQYASAAHEKLAGAAGIQRWEILRSFMQDWAMLRHGDHTAERLRIEHERLKLAKRDTRKKWETKIEMGLGQIMEEIKNNPKAKELFKPLRELLCAGDKAEKEKEFREWIQHPEIRKQFLPDFTRGINPETVRKIEEELRLL